MEPWESPRKKQEEIDKARRKRFDFHMELHDIGFYATQAAALAAFQAEIDEDNPPTTPIDTVALQEMLDDEESN